MNIVNFLLDSSAGKKKKKKKKHSRSVSDLERDVKRILFGIALKYIAPLVGNPLLEAVKPVGLSRAAVNRVKTRRI